MCGALVTAVYVRYAVNFIFFFEIKKPEKSNYR